MINIQPIDYIRNEITDKMDADRGNVVSTIELVPELAGAALGLDSFSHAIVIAWLHQSTFDPAKHLQRHPRNLNSLPLPGILAQRGKNRPNQIGANAVEILEVAKGHVKVKSLDSINGTPVLDIKPYFPVFDKIENPELPDWLDMLMEGQTGTGGAAAVNPGSSGLYKNS